MKYFIQAIRYIGIIIAVFIVGFLAWAFWFALNFHGDTYKDAESYVIVKNDSTEKSTMNTENVVDVLRNFQHINPDYRLITSNEKGEDYHKFGREIPYRSNQYGVFFYFKDRDKTISCIVAISNRGNALLKLHAVSDGINFASWKRINNFKEISRKENREIKKKFETEILDHLGMKWRRKRLWD